MKNKIEMKNFKLSTKTAIVGYTMLGAVILFGCGNGENSIVGENEYRTEVIDNCEYIVKYNGYQRGYMFSHKGNCKFCTERIKK